MNKKSQIKRVWPIEIVTKQRRGLRITDGYVVNVHYADCGICQHYFTKGSSLDEKLVAARKFYTECVDQWRADFANSKNENTK